MSFLLKNIRILMLKPNNEIVIQNKISTSSILSGKKWREDRGLPENPNSFGPLTNLPDYTFMDGRPTPIGSNMRRRFDKQKENAKKIVEMCNELKFAKERYDRIAENRLKRKQELLMNQLKPKGDLMLNKKN